MLEQGELIISIFNDLYCRFLREAAVCRDSRYGVDEEIVEAPMSGVLHIEVLEAAVARIVE